MRVAFLQRSNHEEVRGGDLVQLRATAGALRDVGVDVEVLSGASADLSSFDVVHCFNSPWVDETRSFFDNARRHRRPIAFSTIFWPKDELTVGLAESSRVRLVRRVLGARGAVAGWTLMTRTVSRTFPSSGFAAERRLLASADILLPNSHGELAALQRAYALPSVRARVVRNGVDPSLFTRPPSREREPYVLSVGRVENRKNTLELIEACRVVGVPLVLIGDAGDDAYAERCLALVQAYGFTHHRALEQRVLVDTAFYRAAVHAQVSWYETPGLATMEAACGGCRIVSTDRGSAPEYFGSLVEYCSPWSRSSIVDALRRSLARPVDTTLRELILRDFTWASAAQDTLRAYERLLCEASAGGR